MIYLCADHFLSFMDTEHLFYSTMKNGPRQGGPYAFGLQIIYYLISGTLGLADDPFRQCDVTR